jgi:hypothetical protein
MSKSALDRRKVHEIHGCHWFGVAAPIGGAKSMELKPAIGSRPGRRGDVKLMKLNPAIGWRRGGGPG